VEGAGVEEQAKVGADPRHLEVRHVGLQEANRDAGFARAVVSTLESLVDEIDAGHVPAALGQLDCPGAAAGAEVERAAVGLLSSAFLCVEQLRERRHEWLLVQGLLPGWKPMR
jgi:hypothetical protein